MATWGSCGRADSELCFANGSLGRLRPPVWDPQRSQRAELFIFLSSQVRWSSRQIPAIEMWSSSCPWGTRMTWNLSSSILVALWYLTEVSKLKAFLTSPKAWNSSEWTGLWDWSMVAQSEALLCSEAWNNSSYLCFSLRKMSSLVRLGWALRLHHSIKVPIILSAETETNRGLPHKGPCWPRKAESQCDQLPKNNLSHFLENPTRPPHLHRCQGEPFWTCLVPGINADRPSLSLK